MPTAKGFIEAMKRDGSAFKLDDGNWYGAYKASNVSAERDDYVEFEYYEKNGYNNVVQKSYPVTASAAPEQSKPASQTGSAERAPSGGLNEAPPTSRWSLYNDQQFQQLISDRIMRNNALQAALVVKPATNVDGLMAKANKLVSWLRGDVSGDVSALTADQAPNGKMPTGNRDDEFGDDIPF